MTRTQQIDRNYLEARIGRSVSLEHAAALLGVSRRTIYNRIREGRLLTIRTLGGSQRVLSESMGIALARSGAPRTTGTPEPPFSPGYSIRAPERADAKPCLAVGSSSHRQTGGLDAPHAEERVRAETHHLG
jgi:excisionase family DNA binding protein